MIRLHRLNGSEVIVNAELVESVEAHPDTVIVLATGNRFVIKESVSEVIQRVVDYRKTVYVGAAYLPEFLREDKEQPAGSARRKGA
jgi:flagellar protein FlbD